MAYTCSIKLDSAVVWCLNQCQTFYSTNWTRLVTDTVLMRHRKKGEKGVGGGGEGNNYDTKDSGASMLINALMARLIAIGCPLLLTSTRRMWKKCWNRWLVSLIPFNLSFSCMENWFGDVWRFLLEREEMREEMCKITCNKIEWNEYNMMFRNLYDFLMKLLMQI